MIVALVKEIACCVLISKSLLYPGRSAEASLVERLSKVWCNSTIRWWAKILAAQSVELLASINAEIRVPFGKKIKIHAKKNLFFIQALANIYRFVLNILSLIKSPKKLALHIRRSVETTCTVIFKTLALNRALLFLRNGTIATDVIWE